MVAPTPRHRGGRPRACRVRLFPSRRIVPLLLLLRFESVRVAAPVRVSAYPLPGPPTARRRAAVTFVTTPRSTGGGRGGGRGRPPPSARIVRPQGGGSSHGSPPSPPQVFTTTTITAGNQNDSASATRVDGAAWTAHPQQPRTTSPATRHDSTTPTSRRQWGEQLLGHGQAIRMLAMLDGARLRTPLPAVASDHIATSASLPPTTTVSSPSPPVGLVERLSRRDAALLQNRVFNARAPSRPTVFPAALAGDWHVASQFAGYAFPSPRIPRSRLVTDVSVPGFQKASLAAVADVGKDGVVTYVWSIDPATGYERRERTLPSCINAYLGYTAVREPTTTPGSSSLSSSGSMDATSDRIRPAAVIYDVRRNPNRIGIEFVPYRTINAERMELFVNAREQEETTYAVVNEATETDTTTSTRTPTRTANHHVFCYAEWIRQVTFGTGSTVGVPRQAVTNYAHFWTWQWDEAITEPSTTSANESEFTTRVDRLRGNVLTAAYLDPQDPLYFDEPTGPVVVYSHALAATRIT